MKHDEVEQPQHYQTSAGIECIEAIEAVCEGIEFHIGNALKYLWRAGKKGDRLTDLRKARWYLDRAIARLEKEAS